MANRKAIEENVISLSASIARFFERALSYAKSRLGNDVAHLYPPSVASNLDWYKSVNMLDFLRSVGVHARVNTMLNRERSVGLSQMKVLMLISCLLVFVQDWTHNKAFHTPSLPISSFRPMTFITSTGTTTVQYRLGAQINGVTSSQVLN